MSKKSYGKFKDADALYEAYLSLEKEFTKRNQRLRELEMNILEEITDDIQYACTKKELDRNTRFEIARALKVLGYRKISEKEIVLTRDEFDRDYVTVERFNYNVCRTRNEIIEKIISLYSKKIDQIALELKANFNTAEFKDDFEKTVKEAMTKCQIETLLLTKDGLKELITKHVLVEENKDGQ